MTKRLPASLCLLALLSACDALQAPPPPTPAPAAQAFISAPAIKWAVVDKRKLTEAVSLALSKADPEIEAANSRYQEQTKERKLIVDQISEIGRAMRDKCPDAQGNKGGKNLPSKPADIPYQEFGSSRIYSGADLLEWQKTHNNPAYLECVKKIKEDPLLIDLQTRLETFGNLEREKSQNERQLRELTESTLTKLVGTYGQHHGYQLIINDRDQSIVHNQSKVVLDITADLLDFISQQPLATPPPASDAPDVAEGQ
ncbi:hypothetical protein KFZ76_20620 [Methylovulum psychrotolerans]|uniref:hypothetical protein n=1 Tax=Methylovulum psychrotolerans TaxID=1704499 RepID=UPI001BFF6977|nr:hypothetical protein [Methylovulum psychrotolerans]MBT9100111.1 hypothetical protein [Methylovulum psychrotolerans]